MCEELSELAIGEKIIYAICRKHLVNWLISIYWFYLPTTHFLYLPIPTTCLPTWALFLGSTFAACRDIELGYSL